MRRPSGAGIFVFLTIFDLEINFASLSVTCWEYCHSRGSVEVDFFTPPAVRGTALFFKF